VAILAHLVLIYGVMKKRLGNTAWIGVSPWLIGGAMIILVPIFILLILDNIHKQREHTIQLLLEKGDTLIRSFEAGVRTGMMGGPQDFFHLQKLLIETAQQPDIDYIIVTDAQGEILADSDPSLIGEYYGQELDLRRLSQSRTVARRQVPNPDGIDTFEVFRRFSPSGPADSEFSAGPASAEDRLPDPKETGAEAGKVIFIGLNMGPLETARQDGVRHTILMALVLLFIGLSGIVTLFFAQGYRLARLSLSRIKAFSDNLVEHMPIGLVALDQRGDILSFNKRAEAILQQGFAEVIGQDGAKILPEPLREVLAALAGEKGSIAREIDCPLGEGKTIPLEVIATRLQEEDGTFLGQAVLFRDLTEVRHLKKEVARSQRLASLGNLAAGVAHEIRNPLSSIKGFATYFKERYRDIPEDGETADIMVQEVERLNRVITQLLEFARPVAMEKKPTALPSLIGQTLKMVEGQAREKGVQLHTETGPDIPDVLIDPDKIRQVLLNLYLNSLRALPDGGSLTVKVARAAHGLVQITVADTGPGIAPQDMAHIFDPYFTTSPAGTGLGLSIVHKIIEAHAGEITVQSVPGQGTTVSILLPIGEGSPA